MHGLSHIYIENFRACRRVLLTLGDYTPLVGQNNTGKSTILDAIKLLLAPKAVPRAEACDPEQPIIVAACVEGISPELIGLIPAQNHRAAIEPYCVDGNLWIRIVAATGRPRAEVWEPTGELDELGVPTVWRPYPTGLPDAVKALLPEALHVAAMDDVGDDLAKGKAGSTIRGLLDEIMAPVLEAHAEIQHALQAVRDILGAEGAQRSPLLAKFDTDASSALGELFPGLSLGMDMPEVEVKEFFRTGDLYVTDHVSGERRRFDQMGTGAQRAIQMALIRLLADMRHGAARGIARRLLLIDEPELFLHPQAVRTVREALKTLSAGGFQVVLSTHSPLMISRDNAPDTVIVHRAQAGTAVKRPLREAVVEAVEAGPDQARTLFMLGNVADIYFADKVIVCEGKTDQRLIPLIYEKVHGRRPELDHVCLVSLGGASGIIKGMAVLRAMGIKCAAIADLDFAFVDARKGAGALLDKDGGDVTKAKAVLARLQELLGFKLGGNGLPTNSNPFTAAQVWAAMAADEYGAIISEEVHEALLAHDIWIWKQGCIEDVIGVPDKGEHAIQAQEERILAFSPEDLDHQLSQAKCCVDWIVAR
ncbi:MULTISPECIES: ATP-dependent nuclease [unclassified Luteibacter]|uniref:ATP-dependent nuclease n=1 Tax=Luteibacter sp. PvP019 TaxID=3156436 RepID=UPI003393F7AB